MRAFRLGEALIAGRVVWLSLVRLLLTLLIIYLLYILYYEGLHKSSASKLTMTILKVSNFSCLVCSLSEDIGV